MKCYFDECDGEPVAVCQCNGLICREHMVRTKTGLICTSCADQKIFDLAKNLVLTVGDGQGKTVDLKISKKITNELLDFLEKRFGEES